MEKQIMPTEQKILRAKTLLSIWTRIDKHIAHSERLITLTAQHSFSSESGADALVDKILDRMFKKEKLQKLKIKSKNW